MSVLSCMTRFQVGSRMARSFFFFLPSKKSNQVTCVILTPFFPSRFSGLWLFFAITDLVDLTTPEHQLWRSQRTPVLIHFIFSACTPTNFHFFTMMSRRAKIRAPKKVCALRYYIKPSGSKCFSLTTALRISHRTLILQHHGRLSPLPFMRFITKMRLNSLLRSCIETPTRLY